MTSTHLHFVNTKSGILQESIAITDVDISNSRSKIRGYSRIRFKHSTDLQSSVESTSESFHPVENYLKEQDIADDLKQEESENSERDDDFDLYTTSEHYLAHFMALYHCVITRLKNPDSDFSISSIV